MNPCAVSAARTAAATVKVASVVPGLLSAATRRITSASHIAGLRAGAKPSRNHASAFAASSGCASAPHWSSASHTSPM